MIDTTVEGDVVSLNSDATWLRNTLQANLTEAGDNGDGARKLAGRSWEGDDADGYADFCKLVVSATDSHADRVGRAARAFGDYAARLKTMKATMRGIRDEALAGGLTVSEREIQAPPGVTQEQALTMSQDDYDAAADKVALYDKLSGDTTTAWNDFTDWVDTHLKADVANAEETDDTNAVLKEVTSLFPNFAAGVGAGLTGGALSKAADGYRADAREFLRRSRQSGDPRVKGQADTPAGRSRLDDLTGKARVLGKLGKILSGPAGIGIDVFFGIREAQETGDWTRAAVTTGTSIAAGAGVTALVAAGVVTAPAWATVVAAGALAAGAAWGVGKIYDHRDDISDWSGDRWDDTLDLAGDAWRAATPW